MNKNNAIAIILALLILALLGSGASGYMYFSHELNLNAYRADAAEMHSRELEKQVADLTETARIADERGREISSLRNQAAEFEKQIAELKRSPANTATFTPQGNVVWGNWQVNEQPIQPPQIFLGGLNGQIQNVQVEDGAVKRLQLGFNEQQAWQDVVKVIDDNVQVQLQNRTDNLQVRLGGLAPTTVLGGQVQVQAPNENTVRWGAVAPPVVGGVPVQTPATQAPAEPTRLRTRLTRLVEPPAQPALRVQVVEETMPQVAPTPVKPPKKNDPTTEQF